MPIWIFAAASCRPGISSSRPRGAPQRSEEHTSELQSQSNLVCRLLLEKKKYVVVEVPRRQGTPTPRPLYYPSTGKYHLLPAQAEDHIVKYIHIPIQYLVLTVDHLSHK